MRIVEMDKLLLSATDEKVEVEEFGITTEQMYPDDYFFIGVAWF